MMKLVVLSCMLVAASASGAFFYGAPLLQGYHYGGPLYNYRGPLSLAPGQPASILGADGRPLDTLDVNLDRSAHYTAKAFGGFHLLKKRSLAYAGIAPFAYAAPLYAPYNYRGPLSLAPGQPANILAADGRPLDTLEVNLDRSAHYTAKALDGGVHLLKKRSVALAAPIAPIASHVAYSAPLAYTYASPFTYPTRITHPFAYTAPITHALY